MIIDIGPVLQQTILRLGFFFTLYAIVRVLLR